MQATAARQPISEGHANKCELAGVAALRVAAQSSAPPSCSQSNKRSRDELFAALEHGNPILRPARAIQCPDDLDANELKRCFEILHACGTATDPTATLSTTRAAMEGFLDAVFAGWSVSEESCRPRMEFVAHETAPFGCICSQPRTHSSAADCMSSQSCRRLVYALATYRSSSAILELAFCVRDRDCPLMSPDETPTERISPLARRDIHWIEGNQSGLLRYFLTKECILKIHKHNKHLAIWHTRGLVRGWAKGSLSMGDDEDVLAFCGRNCLDGVLATMGPIACPEIHVGDD